jgi:hypothetical protein
MKFTPLVGWTLLTFLVAEAILVAVFHFQNERDRATIIFGASVLGGAFALFTYLQGVEESRAQRARLLIDRWNAQEMRAERTVLRNVLAGNLDIESIKRGNSGKQRARVISVLNFFEEIARSIRTRDTREADLRLYFGPLVLVSFRTLQDWIEAERLSDHEPGYYTEFEKLAKRWEGRSGPR